MNEDEEKEANEDEVNHDSTVEAKKLDSLSRFRGVSKSVGRVAHQVHLVKRRTSFVETHQLNKTVSEEGHKLVNGYEIVRTLGQGAFGKVKLCKKFINQEYREFAIKIMKKSILMRKRMGQSVDDSAIELVLREIAIMKKLSHPNVVMLHEVIDDPMSNKLCKHWGGVIVNFFYLLWNYIVVIVVFHRVSPP